MKKTGPLSAEKRLLLSYLTIRAVPTTKGATPHSLISKLTGSDEDSDLSSSDEELLPQFAQAVNTKDSLDDSSALKANDSRPFRTTKVLASDDSRPNQVASSNSQATSKQRLGRPSTAQDVEAALPWLPTARLPQDATTPKSTSTRRKLSGAASLTTSSSDASPQVPAPAAEGFASTSLSQSSDSSATSPLSKLAVTAEEALLAQDYMPKRQRSPSLPETASAAKIAKKAQGGGVTPTQQSADKPPRGQRPADKLHTSRSKLPSPGDISQLQRPSPVAKSPPATEHKAPARAKKLAGQDDNSPGSDGE